MNSQANYIMDAALGKRSRQTTSADDPRTLRNRAKVCDDDTREMSSDYDLLKPAEFSELDRANLMRIANAIESLNQVFKTTAKIEITNTALATLDGLVAAINRLQRTVDNLEKTVADMKPKKRDKSSGAIAKVQP